ncbi:MAG: o-succinylbenzoate synthase [Bacteroidales bacterium]|nr:o-succinylbenzoate synthase [Bacteroidales bacterium]
MQASFNKQVFTFRFPAGTSRGILHEKTSWFIFLEEEGITGIGECSVIPYLSPDNPEEMETTLKQLCNHIYSGKNPFEFNLKHFPAICFGLETALKDLETGGRGILFPSRFTQGEEGIPINGLIWMGTREFIEKQIKDKTDAGFRCIKMKVGALDFDLEMDILKHVRKNYPEIELRLDANGAFLPDEAMEKLKRLSHLNIHSIEQPVKPGNWDEMAALCRHSPIPIALDEELIGILDEKTRMEMLKVIQPQYIILKPSLLGGFAESHVWINCAEETQTGWWVTSALESNIGLNAIAQWVYTLKNPMVQGLGTGQLYTNNIDSPLYIKGEHLFYSPRHD